MKSIWFKPHNLADIEKLRPNTLVELLDITFTEIGPDFLIGRMPVTPRVYQPFGVLHGGASVVLAETIGSVAAQLAIDDSKFYCVGQEINANHVRSLSRGFLTGTARPYHIGSTSQVWSIEMRGDDGKLVCISRLTVAVRERKA